jgi:hypothetical protein
MSVEREDDDNMLHRASRAPDLDTAFEMARFSIRERHRFIQNLLHDPRPSKPGCEALYNALRKTRNDEALS